MAEDRSRLLLRSALRSILTAMALGVALACALDAFVAPGGAFLSRAILLLCMGALLAWWPLQAHHPFDRVGIANQITMARGALALILLGLVGTGTTLHLQIAALCVAMTSAALDAVDGWAARRTRMTSSYGARFDMETDALLILTLSILAWQFDKAGVWVLASGLMRYAFAGAGVMFPWLQHPLPPSYRRKAVAVVQAVSLVVAIAPFVPRSVTAPVCAAALALLTGSFLVDIAWLRRRPINSMAIT
jgi:phosphatidylglycerophosphate synthase